MLLRRLAAVAALVLVAPALALAQQAPAGPADGEPAAGTAAGHGSVSARLSWYHNDDGGQGNPFLDEEETVIEPVVVFDYQATEKLGLSATFSYDLVSSASIDRLSRYPEQSGASGDNYFGGSVGVRYALSDALRLRGGISASTEYDYRSFGGSAGVSIDLAERTTTLDLGLNAFFDQVDVIRFDGVEEGSEDRVTLTLSASWYQVVSPTVHTTLGYSFTHQDGFLETAYNSVVIEDPTLAPNPYLEGSARGIELAEELPDTRLRHALFGEVRKLFPDPGTAIGLWGRLYTDSWGISSVALEPRLYQWLIDDVLRLRLRYRLYAQTRADAFHARYRAPGAGEALREVLRGRDRTQDSDLGGFRAHTLGAMIAWQVTPGQTVELALDYVLRSDGLDQLLGSFGWRWEF